MAWAILAAAPGIALTQAISGTVTDSIARAPLQGAIVQLAPDSGPGRQVLTDSIGAFRFESVAPGQYRISFIHPLLDSIGLDPMVHEFRVVANIPVRMDLATPSPTRIRDAMCGRHGTGKAVITGFVRDARTDQPIAGATVAADWLELTFEKGGIVRVMPRSEAITKANGWFALCNVPSDGVMGLFAARGADSTDVLDVHVPENGFLHHDLFLGGATDGRLTGTVISASNGKPIAGAQVTVGTAPPVRANAQGEWSITNLPQGTRNMEVRAVGYYPERRGVHITQQGQPLHVGLGSMRAMLDTVRVRAARLGDRRQSGFEERRRQNAGQYITAQDIAKKNAHSTADLFRNMRGIRIGFASDTMLSDQFAIVDADSMKTTQKRILMRGISGDLCAPSFYINGLYVDRMDADDLDSWMSPREIFAIEIYSEATVPAEFQRAGKGCGSIVIWTKR